MNYTPKAASSKAVVIIIAVLFVGCAGLGYWAVRLWGQLMAAETEIAELRVRSTQVASAEVLQRRNDALLARIAELEAAQQRPVAAAVPAPAPAATQPGKPPSFAALASQMMNTPAMREMMVRTQKAGLERRFTDLMNQLGMSPEDRTRFIDLMSEKQMNTVDIGLKMMSGNLSDTDRAAVVQQVKDANAASDAKLRDFFGNDATYATYQDYVAQQPVRTQVTALNSSLAAAGQPLSPEQSNALAGVMTDARKNFIFTKDFGDPTNVDPRTAMDGPGMETYFQEQALLQGQIADRAAAFLTPDQVAALRQSQATQLNQTRTSMEMARQLMSGK
ncbi:MAG: hypothetical protein ABUL68_01820 [Pseudomonadota bacterium]